MTLPEGLGRPIKGPSALGSDPRRLWQLTWTLAQDRVQARLLRLGARLPVAADAPAAAVRRDLPGDQQSGRSPRRATEPFFPAALLLGIVLFNFFSESTGGAVTSLVNRENLVRKIEFPRLRCRCRSSLTALHEPRPEPGPGADLPARRRRIAASELAASCRCSWSRLALLLGGTRNDPLGRATCAIATSSRSGKWSCR